MPPVTAVNRRFAEVIRTGDNVSFACCGNGLLQDDVVIRRFSEDSPVVQRKYRKSTAVSLLLVVAV